MKMCLTIKGLAGFQDIFEFTHGLAAPRHGPQVPLIDDPLHMLFG